MCGSSFRNKGVQKLLDAIVDFLPAPTDVPPIVGYAPDRRDKLITRKASDNEPAAALAFKITTDPYVGRLTYLRVYSGTIKTGASLLNPNSASSERIARWQLRLPLP